MRAMQIIEWGKPLEARDYPDPEPQGEEVLLRVEAAGVCHSDVHIWDGHFDLGDGKQISLASRGVHLPFTMGHEIAGEVIALGPQASGVKPGDKVVAYPWIGCGQCAVCKKGEELLCLRPRTLGTRVAGGYGTHVLVPHGRYLLPYDGIPQGLAATYTCSGTTAFSALKTMEFGVNILKKGGKLVMVGLYGGAHPISTVLFPFKMMTVEGSYVGTLDDLRELLSLVQAGKVPPIPIETRPADQASAALSDLKSGGKVRGRVVLHH